MPSNPTNAIAKLAHLFPKASVLKLCLLKFSFGKVQAAINSTNNQILNEDLVLIEAYIAIFGAANSELESN